MQSVFIAMADVPPADRATRLCEACNGDRHLGRDVERLLEADRMVRGGGFIRNAVDRALRELANGA